MGHVYGNTGTWLFSGTQAQGASTANDYRPFQGHFVSQVVSGNSAVIAYEAAPLPGGPWLAYLTVTATVGTTAQHNVSGVYPYVRGNLVAVASGSNLTGTVYIHVTPGLP